MQDGLNRTKKLGATGDDVDDVLTWVSKSRQTEQARQAEAAQRRRAAAQKAAARNSDSEDEEDEDMPTAAELAGAKAKHTADELAEGETMILTLGEPSVRGWGGAGQGLAASTGQHSRAVGAALQQEGWQRQFAAAAAAAASRHLVCRCAWLVARHTQTPSLLALPARSACLSAEDRGILDDKGNLDEGEEDLVLENILAVSFEVLGGNMEREGDRPRE